MYFGVSGKATRDITMLASFPKALIIDVLIIPLSFDAPLQGTPANIRINLILPESRVTGLHLRR